MNEPVPPPPGIRTNGVPEVPDLVLRREVDRAHGAAPLPPRGEPAVVREFLKAAEQAPAEGVDVIVDPWVIPKDLEALAPRRQADRMSVVRARVEGPVFPFTPGCDHVHDLRFTAKARELESASRDFSERRQVRCHVVILLGPAAGQSETGEHLIED